MYCISVIFNAPFNALGNRFDLPENLSADLADSRTQDGNSIRRIPVKDVQEVLVLKLAIHIEATSCLQDVAGADGSRSAEGFPYVDFIVLLQEGTVNDTEDVLLMIHPIGTDLPLGDFC
ncbi:MAG: hypothetical protein IJB81_13395 [Clostridia bacterium]|nr:hypothetical protein [Clostridia bacterium]